jgi:solute carrier family 35 (UDP-galactose transporter), member B1
MLSSVMAGEQSAYHNGGGEVPKRRSGSCKKEKSESTKQRMTVKKESGGHHAEDGDKHAGYGWLAVCAVGMIASLTLYGIAMEYATSGGRHLHEISFVFVTTSIYSMTAFVAKWVFGEKPASISKYQMLVLSCTSIASTITSVGSLRYVIFPVQVLFKSCKPVPVMIFGKILGKKYPFQKYVNVMIITSGVALFMGGGTSSSADNSGGDSTLIGAILLSISLCFDGATGAYEDKLMDKDHAGPFFLMYNIQFGKAVISFITLVAINQLSDFIRSLQEDIFILIMLGITGAIGQVFVFVTISKFGALNCALIGLFRKILTLVLSFVLYGHTINAIQSVGLFLALVAMIANFYEKVGNIVLVAVLIIC